MSGISRIESKEKFGDVVAVAEMRVHALSISPGLGRRGISIFAALGLCSSALGYGLEDAIGSWALESEPEKPIVCVVHNTVWLHRNGAWRPALPRCPQEFGTGFGMADDAMADGYFIWKPCADWEVDCLNKAGCHAAKDDWLLSAGKKGDPIYAGTRKIVRTAKSPDWDSIMDGKAYCGYWKPVLHENAQDAVDGMEMATNVLLKIRSDNVGILFFREFAPKCNMKEPYEVYVLVRAEGQYRMCRRGDSKESPDLDRGLYMALWLQPDGRLRRYSGFDKESMLFERTDETFADPIDARRCAAASHVIHGVWGVNSGFDRFVLAFDRDGRGYVSFFMNVVSFKWKRGDDGAIHCAPDEKGMFPQGSRSGERFRVECSYDAVQNEMQAMLVIEREGKDERASSKRLPFISNEGNVPAILGRIESAKKKSPHRK